MQRYISTILGILALLVSGIAADAQVNPVYRQNPVTGAATQQQQITVPSGMGITMQSGASLVCETGAICSIPSGGIGFTQIGTGAAASTVDAKLKQQCVSIADYTGWDPTPGHDNASAFMAAYTAAGTLGYNCLILPGVQFDMSGVTLSAYNNFTVYCQTASSAAGGGTKIRALTTSTTTITVDTVGGFWFDGCTWTSTSQQVSGSYVKFVNTNTSGFTTSYGMYNGFDPLYLQDTGAMHFTGSGSIRSWKNNGITVTGAQDHYFSNLIMDQDTDIEPVSCFYVPQHGGSLTIVNSDLIHCGHGIWINPGAAQFVNWVYLSNIFFDTCDFLGNLRGSNGVNVTPTNGAKVNGLQATNLWTSTCHVGVNLVADATSSISGVSITNHQSLNNEQQALRVTNADSVSIVNPMYAGNSRVSPHTYSGAYVDGINTGTVNFTGGRIGSPVQTYGDTQAFGIQADFGNVTVLGVDLTGNNAGPYAFGGSVGSSSYVLLSPGANTPYVGSSIKFPGANLSGGVASCTAVTAGATITILNGTITAMTGC